MNVILKTIELVNFKGIRNLKIDFGKVTRIYGDNATGKTTLVDAFIWLLFGKDSTDRKEFEIKTREAEKLDHEVTGTFQIGRDITTLRRVYREKWVTRRGSNTPELQGHETLFFWNDVPLRAGEYNDKVDNIIKEKVFRLISNPHYFNGLEWKERREILTSIAGDVDDQDIASIKPEFEAILNLMGQKSYEEFLKQLVATKKKLKDELLLIPPRIDEVSRNIPESRNWKNIQDQIDILSNQIDLIDAQISDTSKQAESFYTEKQARLKRINDLKTKISNIEYEGRNAFTRQMQEKTTAIENAKREIEHLNSKRNSAAEELRSLKETLNTYKSEQGKLREEWMKLNEEEFPGVHQNDCTCYACGQTLPPEKLTAKQDELLAEFNKHKERKLAAIAQEGKGYNFKIENVQNDIARIETYDFDKAVANFQDIIEQWEAKKLESVQSLLKDNKEYHELTAQLQQAEAEPEKEFTPVDNTELKLKKSGLVSQLDALKVQLASKDMIAQSNERRKELLRQEEEFNRQLAEIEQTQFIMSEMIRVKVDMLEGKINSMFQAVQFRLFDTQINGGLVECCDTLVNTNGLWVPWSDGNSAGRVNGGIEIINQLSEFYDTSSPIWIDNAEGVTKITATKAQLIELYVSEADKNLRIEHFNN